MYCYLEEVRKRIHESVSRLHRDIPEIRIGIMAVGDYVRAPITRESLVLTLRCSAIRTRAT